MTLHLRRQTTEKILSAIVDGFKVELFAFLVDTDLFQPAFDIICLVRMVLSLKSYR
jgi:hypothetical protein